MFNEQSIVNADEQKLTTLIAAAKERIVLVAPGVSAAIARVLADKWTELGPYAVQVILDVDPEVCRLGYGTLDGLKLLRERASDLQTVLCQHPGIRIGLLIADEVTLVYSPTPLLVEAGSTQSEHPNAIQLNEPPPEVLRDIGLGQNNGNKRIIGLGEVQELTIQKIEDDLSFNPPVKFDLARKVRVYTSKFQFVELEMTGIYISRKRVTIPSDLIGLARNREVASQFHAHFNLVNKANFKVKVDENRTLTEKSLHDARQEIVRRFLIPLKGYGMVVLRANKDTLREAFEQLKEEVDTFQRGVEEELQKSMDANIEALVDGLFPAVKQSPPDRYTKYYGSDVPEKELRRMLEKDIRKAFSDAKTLAREMRVSLVFKDLTYESLNDDTFLALAQKAIPGIESLHTEFDAAKSTLAEESK